MCCVRTNRKKVSIIIKIGLMEKQLEIEIAKS